MSWGSAGSSPRGRSRRVRNKATNRYCTSFNRAVAPARCQGEMFNCTIAPSATPEVAASVRAKGGRGAIKLREQVTDLRWDFRHAREHSEHWAVGTHAHDALPHQAKPAPFGGRCHAPYRSWQGAPTRNIRLRFRDILWLTTRHMSQLRRCTIRNIAKSQAGVPLPGSNRGEES